jgi:hypothetical protein
VREVHAPNYPQQPNKGTQSPIGPGTYATLTARRNTPEPAVSHSIAKKAREYALQPGCKKHTPCHNAKTVEATIAYDAT